MRLSRVICTHSGMTYPERFHADEVLACAMLKQLKRFQDFKVVRTRDPSIIASADICVDVGLEYDAARLRFDHHQLGFEHFFSEDTKRVRLSSAGLIYKHYAKELFTEVYNVISPEMLGFLYSTIYRSTVVHVDFRDNGEKNVVPVHYLDGSSFSSEVSRRNQSSHLDKADQAFEEAVEYARILFDEVVRSAVASDLPALQEIKSAVCDSKQHDSTGKVLVLKRFCPWDTSLAYLKLQTQYVIYPLRDRWAVADTSHFFRKQNKAIYEAGKALQGVKTLKLDCSYGETSSFETAFSLVRAILEKRKAERNR